MGMKKRFVLGSAALVLAMVLPVGVSVFSGYQEYLAATSPFVLSNEQKAEIADRVSLNGNPVGVLCTGVRLESYSNLETLKLRSEAKAVCDYVAELVPGVVTWVNSKLTLMESTAGKVEISVRNGALPENYVSAGIEACKLRDQRIIRRQPNNVGFPLQRDVIPTVGVAKLLVVPVSFSDAGPEPVLLPWAKQQVEKMVEWYEYFSQGKLSFQVQYLDDWVELSTSSTDYSSVKGTANVAPTAADLLRNARQREFAQRVVNGIGDSADFTDLDAMITIFPRSALGINTSILQRGITVSTPDGRQTIMVWGSGQEVAVNQDKEWALYAHELMHSQGLALHAPGNGSEFGIGQNQYARGATPNGWEMFRAGWLEDSQVACLDAESLVGGAQIVNLGALEIVDGGQKLAVIRLSDNKAIVVESRRATGYSESFTGLNGIIAYAIDVTKDNDRASESTGDRGNDPNFDKWGYLLAPEGTKDVLSSTSGSEKFIIRQGVVVTHAGVTIELVVSADFDSLRITRTP